MKQFTQKAKRVLSLAQFEAERLHTLEIGTEHLLLAMMIEEGSLAHRVLTDLGLVAEELRSAIMPASTELQQAGEPHLGSELKKALEDSLEIAKEGDQPMVGTEHLLLGLAKNIECKAMQVLAGLGVTPEQVKRQTARVISESHQDEDIHTAPPPELAQAAEQKQGSSRWNRSPKKEKESGKTPLVDELATDLTALAEEGKLDPVIGRSKEIERVIQILARRTKNNPALIGEPGVGKTAIVEGIAQRIIEGEVPALLLDKRVLQLDVGSLVAVTMYRGQFEERLKRVIDELKSSGAIVFIDELHMLVGAGGAGSQVDAANILKPALSRGELQVIGATTLNEYRKNIESDAALERRFQPIVVDQPSVEETIEILKGLRPNYEEHHRLKIADGALDAAARLSSRYVSERFLPDKAIDLVDEASSRVRMYKSDSALSSKEIMARLHEVRKNLKNARESNDNDTLQALAHQQEELEGRIHQMQESWDRNSAPTVGEEDIADVISMWTGIPLNQINTEESARLLNLEAELSKAIVGQKEAIDAVSKAIRRARAGLKDPNRPVGSFLFLGPTGVGKTELTKALARQMFGSEDALIQIDMSEFGEKHSVSRLVGAPPGYVGYDEAGQLTEAIRRKPYSLVVFDEIEKAHPEALQILLQIMEEGHLTDAKGHKVDFKNAIIIMTSNIGADLIKKQSSFGFTLNADEAASDQINYNDMRKMLMEALKRSFRPEFINRLDSIIVFRPLNREDIREIVAIEIAKVSQRLAEYKLALQPTKAALDYLAKTGYDPEMGARPVRRVIQQQVEESLSDEILAGNFEPGDVVIVDLAKNSSEAESKISLRKKAPKPSARKPQAKKAMPAPVQTAAKPSSRKTRAPQEKTNA
ncbi:MAG: ATP-dependent Clp protease ATP-binding subunit [Anaerolineaceae bacterium]|nr:ATP-dependent Clp protease ATP-binding subunit [Anaerolineaceae bacterium]